MEENRDEELWPATLLFTHFHLDHVLALPFWKRIGNKHSSLELKADPARRPGWRSSLDKLFNPPFWPVPLEKLGARIEFNDLPASAGGMDLYGARVSWCPLFHPQSCLAYKIETADHSVAIVTDHEHGDRETDRRLLQFAEGVECLVYDAYFTPGELRKRRGWGHGSWEQAAGLAERAGVNKLVLTHHHYERTDDQLDDLVGRARRRFPNTNAAREKMKLF